MKILVTGAGGFLGRYVVRCLLARGHSVRALIRPASSAPNWGSRVDTRYGDLRSELDLPSLFDGIDGVMHLASATSGNEDTQFASSVVATERLLDAMTRSSVKRLIHISSLVVYDWSKAAGYMDENTPLLADPSGMGAYTIAKVWQERLVQDVAKKAALELTIARPGFIWGRNHVNIAAMGRRLGRSFLMFGPLTRLPLTHVYNCADCLVAMLENRNSIGRIYNIVDSDDVRVWRYVREYARRTHQSGALIPLPYRAGYWTARLASRISRTLFGAKGKLPSILTPTRFESQFKPLRYRTELLSETLGWTPPKPLDQCLNDSYSTEREDEDVAQPVSLT
jgi:nucleoside-diphosphate-sugar epimerase